MLDPLKSSINIVLRWVVGGIANIAMGFSSLATYVRDIPGVGEILANGFTWVQSLFNDLGYDVAHFSGYLDEVLDVIAVWLVQMAALASDVNRWISEQVSEISFDLAALRDTVTTWIQEVLQHYIFDLAAKMEILLSWFSAEFSDVWHVLLDLPDYIHGWVTETLYWAYSAAGQALDQVTGLLSTIADLPGLIKAEILQILAPAFNLVELFFEDISDFFSDPADFLSKKVDSSGVTFSEKLWGVVEKILERIW